MAFDGFSVSKLLIGNGDELFSNLCIQPALLARFSVLSFSLELVDGLLLRAGDEHEREQSEDGKEFGHC